MRTRYPCRGAIMCGRVLVLAALAFAVARLDRGVAGAATPATADACAGAGTAANAVIRFYRAVDGGQFPAAYRCFDPAEQARLPYGVFAAGYASSVASRLLLADDGTTAATGTHDVSIELHAVDRRAHNLTETVYKGMWRVTPGLRLALGRIHAAGHRMIRALPAFRAADSFALVGQQVLAHVRADVTLDRAPDDLYLTSGKGCGSCHAQIAWIISGNSLLFEQRIDNGEIRAGRNGAGFELRMSTPGSPGPDCCPRDRTYQEWLWTPFGFALHSQRIVHMAGT